MHQPFIPAEQNIPEFTLKAIIFGSIFGILFGASTVYLALKAGLSVSASIPIAVLSISVLRYFGRPTILENNIVQTIGSAGESVAAGVAFTIPALLFLSDGAHGEQYFNYVQIMTLAAAGGVLGVLFMVPLRRSLIVAEHGNLPYPEGTACADVLIAGEKGGRMAGLVFSGVALAVVYKALSAIFVFWNEAVRFTTKATAKLPNARIDSEISPEYLGVGYILGPKIGGIMVSGSIIAWLVLIPLLTVLALPDLQIDTQLASLGFTQAKIEGWRLTNDPERYYRAYVRLIGAGAVTMAGIITLIKTMPTIVKSLRGSMKSVKHVGGASGQLRTERDIPMKFVIIGALGLVAVMALFQILPGTFPARILMGVLMLVFGFLFVTVSSRIVGLIGASSNPISAMTIATLLATCVVFLALGFGGDANQPVALCVGAIVCIAAANAGATSQDLKTGFLVGATPIRQQMGLIIGVVVSTLIIGLTVKFLDTSFADPAIPGSHGIGGPKFPAPQATLMATIIKGVMSQNLDWGFLLIGAGLSLAVFLCGISPLAWAVGVYLPIGTTFPIFVGGMLRLVCDKIRGEKAESDISPGMLYATGLVAGGTLTGVFSAVLRAIEFKPSEPGGAANVLDWCNAVGTQFQAKYISMSPDLYALIFYAIMGFILIKVALKKSDDPAKGAA
ncbi:MAG: oligopeptide transporter, OPT family [Planctomycetota bacterium]